MRPGASPDFSKTLDWLIEHAATGLVMNLSLPTDNPFTQRHGATARRFRKCNAARTWPSYLGDVFSDCQPGLVVSLRAGQANGLAERAVAARTAVDAADPTKRNGDHRQDNGPKYSVKGCREINVMPHVAQSTIVLGGSVVEGHSTRHAGCAISIWARKRIEERFTARARTLGPWCRTSRARAG
jgi:hypothetical protein